MIAGINESETLGKCISLKCKCKLDGRKCNSDQWWNNDKCWCVCEKSQVCEKEHIWNPSTCSCKNENYLASAMGDSEIMCDEMIESYNKEQKLFQQILMNRKQPIKCKISVLVPFFKITIALLIAVSIYCYLIKYQVKQKHL